MARGRRARNVLFVLAAVVSGGLGLWETGARLVRLQDPTSAPEGLADDPDVAIARARRALDEGRFADVADAVSRALRRRPRDSTLLRWAARVEPRPDEALRLLRFAAHVAPWDVEPAHDALRLGIEAALVSARRAASADDTARRLRAAGVSEGVPEVIAEARRLRLDAEAALDTALSTVRAVAPTARGRRFLEAETARAEGLLAELEALR